MKTRHFLIIAVIFFSVLSCKQTTESRMKSWESNKKTAQNLIQKYPNFSKIISDKLTSSQKQIDDALKIADEKEKIKKLGQINNAFNDKFISQLSSIDSKITTIRNNINKIEREIPEKEKTYRITDVIRNAESAIKTSQSMLGAPVNTYSDAMRIVNTQYQEILTHENKTKNILEARAKELKAKEDELNKKKQEEIAKKKEDEKKELAKVKKCQYCGSKNDSKAAKCTGCGANL